MDGIDYDDDFGMGGANAAAATAGGNAAAAAAAAAPQPGPFTDLVTTIAGNRQAGGQQQQQQQLQQQQALYAAMQMQQAAQQQQQPLMNWGAGVGEAQATALAFMTGGEVPAAAKRARTGAGGATAGSSNQLAALAGGGAGAGGLVEGSDISALFEQARMQQQFQQQQQQLLGGGAAAAAGYGAGLPGMNAAPGGYGAGLPGMGDANAYSNMPIATLSPADLHNQMLMQQAALAAMPSLAGHGTSAYNLAPTGRSGRGLASAAPGPSRLTTGHKHAEYVNQKFSGLPAATGTGRSTAAARGPQNWAAQQAALFGGYGAAPAPSAHDGDQLLSKCEQISANLRRRLGGNNEAAASQRALVERGARLEAATSPLAGHLKPYQLVGINFLLLLYQEAVGGAILADEMGLGKTAQAICFLGLLREFEKDEGPHLVVAPASLLENWERELALWCPGLSVMTYHGAKKEETRNQLEKWRYDVAAELEKGTLAKPPPGWIRPGDTAEGGNDANQSGESDDDDDARYAQDEFDAAGGAEYHEHAPEDLPAASSGKPAFNVMLTTYTLFERVGASNSADRSFLRKWKWSQMVMDEAHALKNATSQRSKRLRKLAAGCKGRVMLTGTPLQNDLGELHNLLSFLLPQLFKDAEKSNEEAGFEELLARAASDPEVEAELIQRMRSLLTPFVLRRLKSELADQMVTKSHKLHEVTMTPEQASMYQAAVLKVREEVMAAMAAAQAAANGTAAGRNARARNLNQKYFSANNEAALAAPIPISKRKRGRPGKKKDGEEDEPIGIMDGLDIGAAAGAGAASSGPAATASEGGVAAMSTLSTGQGATTTGAASSRGGGSELTGAAGDAADTAHTRGGTPAGGGSSQGGGDGGDQQQQQQPAGKRRGPPIARDEAAQMVAKLGSQRISNIFTHLRKICQHPLLVRHQFSDDKVKEVAAIATTNSLFGGNCTLPRVTQEMMGYNDYQLHTFCLSYHALLGQYCLPSNSLMLSGKLVALDGLLQELKAAGSRPLIFSQWTTVLDILEWFLHERQLPYVRLDGSTPVATRLSIVDKFNDPANGVFAFLLSTRAGGQGLNLTGADTVILHDSDFNPQVDRQAEDRCHRLGQTRPVTIHRMILKNTVDTNIYQIAQRKLRLDKEVLESVTVTSRDEGGRGRGRGRGGRGRGGRGDGPGASAADNKHMGEILAALLGGGDEEEEEQQAAAAADGPGVKQEAGAGGAVKQEAPAAAVKAEPSAVGQQQAAFQAQAQAHMQQYNEAQQQAKAANAAAHAAQQQQQ